MQCLHPTRITAVLNDGTEKEMYVPCGQCAACRIAKKREWTIRLLHEGTMWNEKSFLTLTYNPEHLPGDEGLHKRDLQLFFKRLRKALGGRKIRYFACGEYGDRFNRPHYHAILFGVSVEDIDRVSECWNNGFIKLEPVTLYRYQYVCGYVQKKLSGDYAKEVYGDLQPPFQLQSQGLGKAFLESNKEDILRTLSCETWTGDTFGLPRYYRKKLDDELPTEVLAERGVEKRRETLLKLGVPESVLDTPEHIDFAYFLQNRDVDSILNHKRDIAELSSVQKLKMSLDRRKK